MLFLRLESQKLFAFVDAKVVFVIERFEEL